MKILVVVFCLLIGLIIYLSVTMRRAKHPHKYKHLPPKYYGYNYKYWNVTQCEGCGLIGMYEDLHPANACPDCGSKVVEHGAAKWTKVDGLYMWLK